MNTESRADLEDAVVAAEERLLDHEDRCPTCRGGTECAVAMRLVSRRNAAADNLVGSVVR